MSLFGILAMLLYYPIEWSVRVVSYLAAPGGVRWFFLGMTLGLILLLATYP